MGRKRTLTNDQVLQAIHACILKQGSSPTIEELRQRLRVGSTRTVLRYLKWLEDEGAIERWPGARGLKLLKIPGVGLETKLVPIVGEAPAGALMLAEQNREGVVRLPTSYLKPSQARFFLLRVRGNSMNRAATKGGRIESGDLVLVRQQSAADSGDIVVALADGRATIKRLVRGRDYWVLRPESSESEHEPMVVDPAFRVQGVVVRVFKKASELVVED